MRSFNGSDTGSETPRYGFESHTCTLNAFGRLTHGEECLFYTEEAIGSSPMSATLWPVPLMAGD